MSDVTATIVWGRLVGASLSAGAVVAAVTDLPARVAVLLTTFGGGILLSAVALELVPDADVHAGTWWTAAGMLAGTLIYVFADALLTRDPAARRRRRVGHAMAAGRQMDAEMSSIRAERGEVARGESITVGLFVDGVPESLALGLTVATGEVGAALAAGILIGNVVEAYGAAQPIIAGGRSKGFAVRLLSGIGLALMLATVLGGTALADAPAAVVGTAQAVAAGAILAVISISIIPHAFVEVSREVAVGAVLGFTVGYLLA